MTPTCGALPPPPLSQLCPEDTITPLHMAINFSLDFTHPTVTLAWSEVEQGTWGGLRGHGDMRGRVGTQGHGGTRGRGVEVWGQNYRLQRQGDMRR